MSTKQIEALKKALEALEEINKLSIGENAICLPAEIDTAMDAIREALAEQPAHVAAINTSSERVDKTEENVHEKPAQQLEHVIDCPRCGHCCPQPAQQQEPVAWMDGYRNIYSLEEKAAGCPEATIALVPMANQEKTFGSPINELQCVCGAVWLGEEMVHLPDKHPPASKPWVGLSTVELDEIDAPIRERGHATVAEIYRAIEAKLREKNA